MNALRQRSWLGFVLLVLVTVLAYLPSLRAGFIWDDDDYVTGNAALQRPDGLSRIWFHLGATPQYYPLVFTSFWLERHAWGNNPIGYHAVNILLHAAVASLLWLVLRRLAVPGAWWAAAIFAVHPLQVESVAWVAERKNVLSGVFVLASLCMYLRFAHIGDTARQASRAWPQYLAALVLFACALLSKSVVCVLPVVIVLLLWWKRDQWSWRDVWPLIPFFALAVLMSWATIHVERQHVGAQGSEWTLGAVDRCLIAGRALCFYAGKLLWPTHLLFSYPRWNIDAHAGRQYLYPLVVLSVLFGLWVLRRRIGKGPLAAALIFAVALSPALGFVNVYPMRYSFVADHFQYLAGMALIALFVAAAVTGLLSRSADGRVAQAVGVVLLGTLVCLTWPQQKAYVNEETLWRTTLAGNPHSWLAHGNLAAWLKDRGAFEEALSHMQEALRLAPNYPEPYINLGNLLFSQGRPDEAAAEFRKALQIDPHSVDALNDLGLALAAMGQLEEAASYYEEALHYRPEHPSVHNNLASALSRLGKTREALDEYRKAIEFLPGNAEAHNNLGNLLVQTGQLDDAALELQEAIRLEPSFAAAHNNLANILARQDKPADAIAHYKEALRLDLAEAHAGLAEVLAKQGRFNDALEHYVQAVRQHPENAQLQYGLGNVLAMQGKLDEATPHFQAAVREDPQNVESHRALAAAFQFQGRSEEAIAACRALLLLQPTDVGVHNNLGIELAQTNRLDEAIDHFKEAIRIRPEYAPAWLNLGQALTEQGNLIQALAALNESLRLEPNSAETHFRLGEVFTRQGKSPEAVSEYREAVRLNPNHAEAVKRLNSPGS